MSLGVAGRLSCEWDGNVCHYLLTFPSAPARTEELYIALKFYKQIPDTVIVDFVFVIVPNLEPVLEVHE